MSFTVYASHGDDYLLIYGMVLQHQHYLEGVLVIGRLYELQSFNEANLHLAEDEGSFSIWMSS